MIKRRATKKPAYKLDCGQKRAYRTQAEAMDVAEVQMLSDWHIELHTYRCPYGHGWHLTRSEKSDTI